MGRKPTTMPESVVDSLALTQSTSESSEVQDEVDEVGEMLFGDVDPDETTAGVDESGATVSPESSSTDSTKVKKSSSKKKKCSRGDQFEVVMDGVIKELVSAQERNEKMYLELKKRMKMEERMFKKELEAQKESRQFQLQMMQMMASVVNDHGSAPFPVPPFSWIYVFSL